MVSTNCARRPWCAATSRSSWGKIGLNPTHPRRAAVADKRARHLQHLIEELLDLSRIEAGRLSLQKVPIAVGKHARGRRDVPRRAGAQEVTIEIDIPADLPAALATTTRSTRSSRTSCRTP
jgi:signal transduction histidine kinase